MGQWFKEFDDTVGVAGNAILDVPADAINASTGTGENLGWFGVVDREVQEAITGGEIAVSKEEAQRTGAEFYQAPATAENTGLSGFWTGAQNSAFPTLNNLVGAPVLTAPYQRRERSDDDSPGGSPWTGLAVVVAGLLGLLMVVG